MSLDFLDFIIGLTLYNEGRKPISLGRIRVLIYVIYTVRKTF